MRRVAKPFTQFQNAQARTHRTQPEPPLAERNQSRTVTCGRRSFRDTGPRAAARPEPLLVPRETTKRAGARPRLSGGGAAIDAQALRLLLRLTGLTFLRACNRVKREHETLLQADAISQFCPCYTPRRDRLQASAAGFDRWPKGSVLSEHAVSLRTCQVRPIRAHTCSGITWRLCGGLGASVAQDLRALRLWQSSRQWRAVPWSCIDAAPGCRALRRSSVNILMAWPGRVAQAPRAGRARAIPLSFSLATILPPEPKDFSFP